MKRPEPDSPDARRRSDIAAEWLVRRDRGLTAAEQDQFLDWLAEDPRHGEWLELHRQVTADFAALAHWRPEHSDEPNPDLLAPAARKVYWVWPTILAAAAAVILIVASQHFGRLQSTASVAGTSEIERRILEDGTSVELNRGALVTTKFSPSERRATLVRGEAYFNIAKNPARPFIVHAAGVDVRAVGTAFSVRCEAETVEVLVTEGKVAVADSNVPRAENTPPPEPALVVAGQRATVSLARPEPPAVAPVSPEEITRHLTWQPQLLDFSSAPLVAAISEFNRRNRVQFVLADVEIGEMPIVASIRSDNVEGFAKFLAGTPGLSVERRGSSEIVVHRKR